MFCPKCGNQLPDNASFCGQCGNKIENAPAAANTATTAAAPATEVAAGAAGAASSVASSSKLSPIGIAAVVIAIVAFLFSLPPWFEVSSLMSGVAGAASGLASGVSSFLGGGSSSFGSMNVDDAYSVWSLVGFSGSLSNMAQAYSSFGGSRMTGAATAASLLAWCCLILWIVSLASTVWGSITAFTKGKVGFVRTASIFMVITVIVFYIFAGAMGSDAGTANAMPVFCLLLSIVALVCSFTAKKKEVQ